MFLPDDFIDTVRGSVDIVQVISEHLTLRRRGKNYVALCPFHPEKTPSFNVSPQKQIFHCFGCSTGGDVFKFVSLIERVTFPEAVRLVAEKAGIPVPRPSGAASSPSEERQAILDALKEARDFYHAALLNTDEGRAGYNYLLGRGITHRTIEMFGIGYAPGSGSRLLDHLSGQGFSTEVIERAGLIRRNDDAGAWYDYFRRRIIFPITDVSGRVVAFGGRALADVQPKYLNTPETPVYSKGRNLFGLSFSKDSIRNANFAILVEGYLDFLTPFQAGITNLVASLGTALTEHQVRLLGRYTRNVVLNYDSDTAGLAAAKRSLEILLEEGFKVNVVVLPAGKDPDAFVRDYGAERYKRELKGSVPYIEFIAKLALKAEKDITSARGKINVLNSILPYLAKVENRIERATYASRIAQSIGINDELILSELRKAVDAQRTKIEGEKFFVSDVKPAEGRLLRALLDSSDLRAEVLAKVSPEDFQGLRTEKIFGAIIQLNEQGVEINYANLRRQLGEEDLKLLISIYFQQDVPIESIQEAVSCVSALRRYRLERLQNYSETLKARLREAELRRDEELIDKLLLQKRQIDQQLISLYKL